MRDAADKATLLGAGKVEELATLQRLHQASVVEDDDDLTPSQQRNLEKALGVKVIDRTQLILDIFAHRARTRGDQERASRKSLAVQRIVHYLSSC
ncbi:MAG: hypothetical protein HC802_12245 [Caldilineaceae bacterium]|nr:hypothetical protein [Caldilineaceae bacterium]